ncbi:YIP1 family protein [Desulfarculales bacterium]
MPENAPQFQWRYPQTFWAVAVAAATTPRDFFAQMPRQGGYLPPLAFFVAAMLLPTLVRSIGKWSEGPVAMLTFLGTSLLFSLVMVLVFAFALYCVCRFLFQTILELPDVTAIVCYSSGVRILEFVPQLLSPLSSTLLAIIMVLFIGSLVWTGLHVAGNMNRYQALMALGLSFVAIVGLWLLVNVLRGNSPLPGLSPAAGAGGAPAPGGP